MTPKHKNRGSPLGAPASPTVTLANLIQRDSPEPTFLSSGEWVYPAAAMTPAHMFGSVHVYPARARPPSGPHTSPPQQGCPASYLPLHFFNLSSGDALQDAIHVRQLFFWHNHRCSGDDSRIVTYTWPPAHGLLQIQPPHSPEQETTTLPHPAFPLWRARPPPPPPPSPWGLPSRQRSLACCVLTSLPATCALQPCWGPSRCFHKPCSACPGVCGCTCPPPWCTLFLPCPF